MWQTQYDKRISVEKCTGTIAVNSIKAENKVA